MAIAIYFHYGVCLNKCRQPILPPNSESTWTKVHSFRCFRSFEVFVASRLRRDPNRVVCFFAGRNFPTRENREKHSPSLTWNLKMMVPKGITYHFLHVKLWEGRGMIFCIEIKPFLLVKLGEVSESMKSDTNPNFMHFKGISLKIRIYYICIV